MSLIEEAAPGEAARFVFVIDQGFGEIEEPHVLLLGFSASGQEVCRWRSGGILRKLGDAKKTMPAPVEIQNADSIGGCNTLRTAKQKECCQ